MEHEFKIIYKFNTDGNTGGTINTTVYLDNNPIGLIQAISFKHNAKQPLHKPPEIIIDFPDEASFNLFSENAKKTTIGWLKKFKNSGVIKSNLLQVFDKYINLIAFWWGKDD